MKEKVQIYILTGFPGAGKSTWAREQVSKDPGIMIVNNDKLREMVFGKYEYRHNTEDVIRQVAELAVFVCVFNGYDVIVDETNLSRVKREQIVLNIRERTRCFFDKGKLLFNYVSFTPSIEHLKRRMSENRDLGEDNWIRVYNEMLEAYEPVTKEEMEELGISGHTVIGGIGDKKPKVEDWLLYQRIYCSRCNVPVLAPQNGICFMCNKNIAQTENWVEIAANTHITNCPHCQHSFCE